MAETTNITKIEAVPETIQRFLEGLCKGLGGFNNSSNSGISAIVPDEVEFSMVIIEDWQSLQVAKSENSQSNESGKTLESGSSTEKSKVQDKQETEERQTGGTTQSVLSQDQEVQAGNEVKTAQGANQHNENGSSDTTTTTS